MYITIAKNMPRRRRRQPDSIAQDSNIAEENSKCVLWYEADAWLDEEKKPGAFKKKKPSRYTNFDGRCNSRDNQTENES